METPTQPSRVRSALFAPVITESAAAAQETQTPESAEPVVAKPQRARKPAASGRAKRAATLQVTCDQATWAAVRIEALKRRVSVSKLVMRALSSYYPAIGAAINATGNSEAA